MHAKYKNEILIDINKMQLHRWIFVGIVHRNVATIKTNVVIHHRDWLRDSK